MDLRRQAHGAKTPGPRHVQGPSEHVGTGTCCINRCHGWCHGCSELLSQCTASSPSQPLYTVTASARKSLCCTLQLRKPRHRRLLPPSYPVDCKS
eukprot:361616-Chlamydomonas_euryale.AAC.14